MLSASDVETYIQYASDALSFVEAMDVCLHEMMAVLEQEHEAVRSSSLVDVEAATRDKVRIGSEMLRAHESLVVLGDRVRRSLEQVSGEKGAVELTLAHLCQWLAKLRSYCLDASLGVQVLDHILSLLEKKSGDFMVRHAAVRPKIEMNVYLTQRLLENHRQTVRFWQEVMAESESVYTQQGLTRKVSESATVLRVKA